MFKNIMIDWLIYSILILFAAYGSIPGAGFALTDDEIPATAPDDAVMAGAGELSQTRRWGVTAFTGEQSGGQDAPVSIHVRRQDFNVLRFGQSCMETPITIGQQTFQHGLGTHANSEIAVSAPGGSTAFKACIGVDNNFDTQGQRGSAVFSIEIHHIEVYRSSVLRGGNDPVPVEVKLPAGAKEIILKVDTTEDGPGFDQTDWADARFELDDGRALFLDENQDDLILQNTEIPFSFIYDGIPSREFLDRWTRTVDKEDQPDRWRYDVQWTDPKTALRVSADVSIFKDYPAVDWVLYFENQGSHDTPILENIQAVDVNLRTGNSKRPAVLHQIHGDACAENSFLPFDSPLEAGKKLSLAPAGGRSSSISAFPFFNLQYRDQGMIAAIGWSGQWAASLDRAAQGPARFQAGMEKTRLVLHPGERIRSPRILIMPWEGGRITAHNRFRRLLLFHYVPRLHGKPLRMPVVLQTFDRYVSTRPEWATEAGQLEAARFAQNVGCDTYWLDAAWFVGGFPNGVGNWFTKPNEFPRGLKPISDLCHSLGLKFVVWFEPERVAAGAQIAREHPEFVFGGEQGGLFKLNDPDARRWLTDLLLHRIQEFGLDVYRNDFNIDPLDFWRRNDAPDRQGITEIRYIEGLYAMWDEIRAKNPHLFIDNCSSGGRRIDIETLSRSVPLWRSDTSCSPGHPDWNQVQTVGLGSYVPLFTAAGWVPDPYDFRSSATAGAICQWAYLDPEFPMTRAKETLAEAKENQKYWYGDFYPLTPCSNDPGHWMAYQFHRSDRDAGIVLIFKHAESPYTGLSASLRALNPDRNYTVDFIDEERKPASKTMTGRECLEGLEIRLPQSGRSLLIRYRAEGMIHN
ncbi:MAG: NPCBM/NEW2 domain-containing protein [bacterium]